MNTMRIIVIGAAIALGLPIVLGVVLSRIHGWVAGIAGGGLLFLLIATLAHFAVRRKAQQNDKGEQE